MQLQWQLLNGCSLSWGGTPCHVCIFIFLGKSLFHQHAGHDGKLEMNALRRVPLPGRLRESRSSSEAA